MKNVNISNLKYYWKSYLLVVIPLALVFLFSYYPIFNGLVHMFYRWDGDTISEFIGFGNFVKMFHDTLLWRSFAVLGIFCIASLFKMVPPIIASVILHHIRSDKMQYLYRVLFVIPMIVPSVVWVLIWKYYYEPNMGLFNQLLRQMGFLGATETIQWLSDKNLIIPSLIFCGFPWIGAFGVLIYLAGLQGIGQDIYEAADLDGACPLRVFWNIEMPLITTQIRINLMLVIIGTLQEWSFVYLFLGESGGPDGVAMIPGLYIFKEAFSKGFFGYGCAIGFVLFVLTLILTWINNRYMRIEK